MAEGLVRKTNGHKNIAADSSAKHSSVRINGIMDCKVLLLTLLIATVAASQTTPSTTANDPTQVLEDSSTESAEELQSSGTAARYTFTEADARTSLSPAPTNDLVTEDDDDDSMEAMEELEKILSEKDKPDNDEKMTEVKTVVSTTDEDDDDEEEEEDNDGDDVDEDILKPPPESIPPPKLRRLGDLQPGLLTDESDANKKPEAPAPVYIPNPEPSDSSGDGSPLLHLTQGGYQRPDRRFFGIYDQRQRLRTGSASQQSERVESPENQPRPLNPQTVPPYQPQNVRPMFQHPFALPGGIQSGFFNTPPAGFTDFSSANFQTQFQPVENGPYTTVPRDQNGFSMFQTPPRQNQGGFHANLPYQQPQPVYDGHPRGGVQPFLHPGGFSGMPNLDFVDDSQRPNYSPYIRPQLQFPANPNFYGSVPNANFVNAGMMPNIPANNNRQPVVFRYPDNPLTLQTSDQVDKQKKDTEDVKDSDALTTSQDKEDPATVPFGARIKQGNDDSSFLGPEEVYLRYPIQEAGYATEENLPVRNTTEKSRNSDPTPSNPTYPFFAQPDDLRPFSNPDPYRDALNVLRQGYPSGVDASNQTGSVSVGQFSANAPVPFDERLSPPTQLFPAFQRNQPFPNRPFLPMPGLDGRNPFYPGVQGNNFMFHPPPISARSAQDSRKTPSCAKDNSTVCFEDVDYPMRELIYAMNSDSLIERLSSYNQVVEEVILQSQKISGGDESDNSICKSQIKYGLPLRAKNLKESWKVIVNLEKSNGNRQFIQPVRLEICKDADQPCSFTQVKTSCMQKYNLQSLLSWSPEQGIHTDVFRLPIACSCQVVDEKA